MSTEVQHQIIQKLQLAFTESQNRRDGYSLRRFAKRLGVEAPVLSQVLANKRKVTRKLAEKLLAALKIDQDEIDTLIQALPKKQERKKRSPTPASITLKGIPLAPTTTLSPHAFNIVADWWYFAILSLAETKNCKSDPAWIGRRLNITATQAKKGLATLQQLGLIELKNRTLHLTGKRYESTTDVPSVSVRRNHLQGLDLAREALINLPPENREFGATVFAGDPNLLNQVKQFLRESRSQAAAILESGEKQEVYRLQIQLFPVTQKQGEK